MSFLEPQLEEPRPPDRPAPSHERHLFTDVLLTLGNKFGVLALNVAGTVVVARTLGPSGRGAIAVALSLTLLLVQFGSFGIQTANPFFASREPGRTGVILSNTIWLSLCLGLALAGAGVFVRAVFPASLRGLAWLNLAVVMAGIPSALANQLLQSILLAEGRMVSYNAIEFGMAVVTFLGLFIGLVVFSIGVTGAIVLMVSASIAGTVGFLGALRHHKPMLRRPDIPLMRVMLRYGFRVYLATLLAYLVGRVNLLLVNSYLGTDAAGEYSISLAIADGVHLLPTVVALNLFPRVARGDPSGDTAVAFRSLVLIYGLLCLVTIPLAAPAINLLYGPAFSDAVGIYYWMVPAIFAYGMISVLAYHFAGHGFPMEALLVWIPGLLVNFGVVVPLLANHASVDWAAGAASLGYGLILLLHVWMFGRDYGSYRSLVPRPREAITLTVQMIRALRPRSTS